MPWVLSLVSAAAAMVTGTLWLSERTRSRNELAKVRRACDNALRRADVLAERLEAQADWHALTLRSIADAVITTNPAGQVQSMNATAEAWTGWNAAESHGMPIERVFPVDGGALAQPARRVDRNTSDSGYERESTLVARDGTTRVVEYWSAPIVHHDGRRLGSLLTFRDVSSRRQAAEAERRLREAAACAEQSAREARIAFEAAHRKFAAFMANFPYPAFIQDDRGEFVFMNAAGEASAAWRDATAREAGAPAPAMSQTVSVTRDRHYFCIRFPLAIDGRQWLGGIAIDVSDRIRAERALSERTAEFETLFNHVPAPLWLARDASGNDIVGNDAAHVLLGTLEQPDAMDRCQFFRNGLPLAPDEAPIRVAMRERAIVQGTDVELGRADGSRRHVRITAAPLYDAKGQVRGAVAAGLDITQLKTYEAELERAVRRRDEFLAVLAHELRNPLAPIRNSVQILQRVPQDVERVRRATGTIDRQTSLLVRLIDDLLDVARISQGLVELDLAPRSVAAIVDGALEVVRSTIEFTQHTVDVEHRVPGAIVRVDALRAEQVLVNLLSNALKYSPPRTHVTVRSWIDGDRAYISVTDHGQGIPAEFQSEIFTMFARPGLDAKNRISGMGVGLALAKQLCEQQGGSIDVASEGRGRGATFTASFPLARAAAHAAD